MGFGGRGGGKDQVSSVRAWRRAEAGSVLVHFRGGQQNLLVGQMQGMREREVSCPKQLAGGKFMEMEKTKDRMVWGRHGDLAFRCGDSGAWAWS